MEYDYLKIAGQSAVVTGGGRGIGRATALALGRFGAKVVVCDVRDDWGEDAVREIREGGGTAMYCHCDVADPGQVKVLVQAAVGAYGTVDILVNNAGIGSVSLPFEEITDEDWDRMLRVDLTAPFYLCREVIPYMKAKQHGKIINISSGSGIIGCEFCSHYASAKAGLIGFTQSIAKELGKDHINANAIAVPTTQTPMLKETDFDVFVEDELRDIPWGRIGTPEDIADMVLYLSSDASEYVTGQVLAPNGGRRTPV